MRRTPIMMLGRTGTSVGPQVRTNYLPRRLTTPQQPQNLMRATLLNGLGCTSAMLGTLGGLGAPGDNEIIDPWVTEAAPEVSEPVTAPIVEPGRQAVIADGGQMPPVNNVQETLRSARDTLRVWVPISLLSGALSAYHGYKRDKTAIAGWGWFTLGTMFPLLTPAVAVYQGFGKSRRG